jgi:hypothetical protein
VAYPRGMFWGELNNHTPPIHSKHFISVLDEEITQHQCLYQEALPVVQFQKVGGAWICIMQSGGT